MFLKNLKIINLKKFEKINYVFSSKRNIISGSFGTGKTTTFEAIYFSNFLPLNFNKSTYKNLVSFGKNYSAIYCDITENNFKYQFKTFIQNNKITFYKNEKNLKEQQKQKYIFSFFVSVFEDVFENLKNQKKFFYEELLRNHLDYFVVWTSFEQDFEDWFEITSNKLIKFSIDKIQKLEKNMIDRILLIKNKLKNLQKEIFDKSKEVFDCSKNFSFLKRFFLNEKLVFETDINEEIRKLKEFWKQFRENKEKKINFFDLCFQKFETFFDSKYLKNLSKKQQKIFLIFLKLGAAKNFFIETKKEFVFCIDDFDVFSIETQQKLLKLFPKKCQLILLVSDFEKTFYIKQKNNFELLQL